MEFSWLVEIIKEEGVGFTSLVIYTFITLRFLGYMRQRDKDITDQREQEMKQASERDQARDEQNTKLIDLMARSQNNTEALRINVEQTNRALTKLTDLLQQMMDTSHSDQVQTTSAINVNSAKIDTLVQSTDETTKVTRKMIGTNEELNKQIAQMVKEVRALTVSISEGVNLKGNDHNLLVDIKNSNELLLDKLQVIEDLAKQEPKPKTEETKEETK